MNERLFLRFLQLLAAFIANSLMSLTFDLRDSHIDEHTLTMSHGFMTF